MWIKASHMVLELNTSRFESQLNHFTSCEPLSKICKLYKPYLPPFVGINLDAESKLAESMA